MFHFIQNVDKTLSRQTRLNVIRVAVHLPTLIFSLEKHIQSDEKMYSINGKIKVRNV